MPARGARPLVVIVGLGETGVLTATRLSHCDIVGVATKPVLVSGQELGLRLVDPEAWKRDYLTELGRFRKLKGTRLLIGRATSVKLAERQLHVELAEGGHHVQPFDYLVIATGISNGFWRDDQVREREMIERDLAERASHLRAAHTIAIVGGGPTGTSAAANLAIRYPEKQVHFFHSGELPLPGYHDTVRGDLARLLADAGVHRHPHHRAEPPAPERMISLDGGTIEWQGGQSPFSADAILWATGATRPNSGFLPPEILDGDGYVLTEPTLQVRGWPNVFAIGDVAQTDANRSSARNWAHRIVADNIAALIAGRPERLRSFSAPANRWGSIIGPQQDGLTIYQTDGRKTRMARWFVERILFPIVVRRGIYRGIRAARMAKGRS